MRHAVCVLLGLISVSFGNADYIQMNSSVYQVNNNVCPTGDVCDFAFVQGTLLITQIQICNTTLEQMFNNGTDNQTIMTFTTECLRNLSREYDALTILYVVQQTSGAITINPSTLSNVLMICFSLRCLSNLTQSVMHHKNMVVLMLVMCLACRVRALGSSKSIKEANGYGGYGSHAKEHGARVTSDGHVESGNNYYWMDTAVSSRSHLFAQYVVSHDTPCHEIINASCTVKKVTKYIDDQVRLASGVIEDFNILLKSSNRMINDTIQTELTFNSGDFIDLFNSMYDETVVLTTMCHGNNGPVLSAGLIPLIMGLMGCI